ncbi:MAG: ABC transporter ATP-binding protein [Nitrososphaerota archaeon]|uniref:ABC transporter ATP-binding protein n=1 Tax=Pyrobaculum sp. TaxID=2004705 RepID=UPI003179FD62
MVRVRVEGVEFSYPGRPVLKGITVDIPPNAVTAILGPNGSGKTTLLRVIAGVLRAKRGVVYVNGRSTRELGKELYKQLGYVPQRISPTGRLRAIDLVVSSRKPHMMLYPSARDYEKAEEALKLVGASHLRDRFLEELSGGELQLVLIARALAVEPRVLLLDEPLNNLDVRNQLRIMSILKDLSKTATVIAVLHDLNIAYKYADYAIFMKDGEIHAAGPVEGTFSEDVLEAVYGVRPLILREHKGVLF